MEEEKEKPRYPKARRCGCTIDKYHGRSVPDAYRWLENPEDDEVKTFVDEQNKFTEAYMSKYPYRNDINKLLAEFVDYQKIYCPEKHGSKYFFYRNTGLQNQDSLYVGETLLHGKARILVDANSLSEDGTVSLVEYSVSRNGQILAYTLTSSGSDWRTVRFKVVETGQDLSDILEDIKFSEAAWSHDNHGVFYARFPKAEGKTEGRETTSLEYHKLYYHTVGTRQAEDILISEFPENPRWLSHPEVSDCGKYVINSITQGCSYNMVYVATFNQPVSNTPIDFIPVIDTFAADVRYITNDGSIFYFHTNKDAPNFRVVKIDINNPSEEFWKTLIPEDKNDKVLSCVKPVNKNMLLSLQIQDVRNVLQLRALPDGSILKVFPTYEMGSVVTFSSGRHLTEFFYSFSSFTSPQKIYFVDLQDGQPKQWVETKVNDFDPSKYLTLQVLYISKDGAKISMYIVKKKTAFQNGENPCLLYGYGGFNISVLPNFNAFHAFFLKHCDGILAIANIRGGGEYGSKWHTDGSCSNKQNSFDDFQAAAAYLVDNNFTNRDKLAIIGGSNGGLLVGACITQRPDLCRAAVAQRGVFDMLRFHKFTIGFAWIDEYGCSDIPEEFEYLYKYSPLHRVKMQPDSQYPSVLVTTADHDDRVSPLHSYKFIAELQAVIGQHPAQTNPLLLRVESKSGHGLGASLGKKIVEWTDIYTFLAQELNLTIK